MGQAVDNRPGRVLVSALTQCRIVYEKHGRPMADKFASGKHSKEYEGMSGALKKIFHVQNPAPFKHDLPPPGTMITQLIARCKVHRFLVLCGVKSFIIVITAGISEQENNELRKAVFEKGKTQFRKWEKITTLGESMSVVMDACMKPGKEKVPARMCSANSSFHKNTCVSV